MSSTIHVSVLYDVPYSTEAMRLVVGELERAVKENWTLISEVQQVEPSPDCLPPEPVRWLTKLSIDQLEEEDPWDREERLNPPPGVQPEPENRFWDSIYFTFSPLAEDCIGALFQQVQTGGGGRIGLTLWMKRGMLVIGGQRRQAAWEALRGTSKEAFVEKWQEPLMQRMFLHLVERVKAVHPLRSIEFDFEEEGPPWNEEDLARLDEELRLLRHENHRTTSD